ncbi:MAG TPA: hypothetical protein VGY55_18755, partial [Pirellulales bacterium]|nr:hypothetical protein [Pirellulales bacterium]
RLPAVGDNGAMQSEPPEAELPKRKLSWLRLTPDRILLGLLAVEVLILSCASFHWFGFHDDKVWTACLAFGSVAVAAVLFLIRPHLRGRRWYQFSLRSLMIFTLIVATASAWLGRRIEQKRREHDAVVAIKALHGWIQYDYEQVSPHVSGWYVVHSEPSFFSEVISVELRELASDADLVNLKCLNQLEFLDLSGSQVTDAGLANLKEMGQLLRVDVKGTKVTFAGVRDFQKALPNCDILFDCDTDY